jgi:hypothetical protein
MQRHLLRQYSLCSTPAITSYDLWDSVSSSFARCLAQRADRLRNHGVRVPMPRIKGILLDPVDLPQKLVIALMDHKIGENPRDASYVNPSSISASGVGIHPRNRKQLVVFLVQLATDLKKHLAEMRHPARTLPCDRRIIAQQTRHSQIYRHNVVLNGFDVPEQPFVLFPEHPFHQENHRQR